MTVYQSGTALIYIKPRSARAEGDRWEEIPATFCCRVDWGGRTRYKIYIEVDGFSTPRYVHPLSVRLSQQHCEQRHE